MQNMPLEAAAGLAVSIVTALLARFGLSGELKYLLVVALSAIVALLLTGSEITAQTYMQSLGIVLASAVTAHQIAKSATVRRAKNGGDGNVVAE